MDKKLALLLCLFTVLIVGSCVFFTNQRIDFPTLFLALKLAVPAGIIAYILGLFSGKVLQTSKGDTELINSETQQQFVDDLLLRPDQVLTSSTFVKVQHEPDEEQEETSQE